MAKEKVWLERVLAWRASGHSAAKFCEGTSFKAAALSAWSSRLGREGKVPRAVLGPQRGAADATVRVGFARLVTQHTDDTAAANVVVSKPRAIVVSVGPSRIELTRGFDRTLLRAVVETLSERAS